MKKPFYVPCLLLVLLFCFCLAVGRCVTQWTNQWTQELDIAFMAIEHGDWETARHSTTAVYDDWSSRQRALHILTDHDELDTIESLLQETLLLEAKESTMECELYLCQIKAQFSLLQETQAVSIKNVL